MQSHSNDWDPDGFLDYERPPFVLIEYEVVSKSPLRDPLQLSRSRVVAPTLEEAWEFLHETGGWMPRHNQPSPIFPHYDLVVKGLAKVGQGMSWDDWNNAVLLGYLPHPVRLVEGAKTVDQPKPVPPVPELPKQKVRRGIMADLEAFFRRQECYPRTWKMIGTVVAVSIGLVAVWMLWQVLISLLGLYVVARVLGVYASGR